jgi:hypothetical protein
LPDCIEPVADYKPGHSNRHRKCHWRRTKIEHFYLEGMGLMSGIIIPTPLTALVKVEKKKRHKMSVNKFGNMEEEEGNKESILGIEYLTRAEWGLER